MSQDRSGTNNLRWLKYKDLIKADLANPPASQRRQRELEVVVAGLKEEIARLRGNRPDKEQLRNLKLFRRRPQGWICIFGGKAAIVRTGMVGFQYIVALLATPLRKMPCAVLESLARDRRASLGKTSEEVIEAYEKRLLRKRRGMDDEKDEEDQIGSLDFSSTGRVIDGRGIKEARNRLAEIQESLEGETDPLTRLELEEELASLSQQIRNSTIPGGQIRRLNPESDKVRVRVKNCIDRAIIRLQQDHNDLALHLKRHIKTGYSCQYIPDSKSSISWIVRTD